MATRSFQQTDTFWDQTTRLSIEYLIVAGGGGGATWYGGGGGGGGVINSTLVPVVGTTYTVTVGAGGAGRTAGQPTTANADATFGSRGSDSLFNGILAHGGGASLGYNGQGRPSKMDGGSGAGGRPNMYGSFYTSGNGVAGQGWPGGTGNNNSASGDTGGGGGGAGGPGKHGHQGGHGGIGIQSSITGTATYYAGGGGGGGSTTGGSGGGGAGTVSGTPTSGTANIGGGGGGNTSTDNVAGGAGGSGVVILKAPRPAASTTGSPTTTTVNGSTIYTFTGDGSITW